jgi:hypothetical protein
MRGRRAFRGLWAAVGFAVSLLGLAPSAAKRRRNLRHHKRRLLHCGQGTLVLKGNIIRGNGGPRILKSRLRLLVDSVGNDVSGNETA